jgi:hypothetical protein
LPPPAAPMSRRKPPRMMSWSWRLRRARAAHSPPPCRRAAVLGRPLRQLSPFEYLAPSCLGEGAMLPPVRVPGAGVRKVLLPAVRPWRRKRKKARPDSTKLLSAVLTAATTILLRFVEDEDEAVDRGARGTGPWGMVTETLSRLRLARGTATTPAR